MNLGKSNTIHPTAILEGNITLGEGNVIGPYCVFRGDIEIGNGNHFQGSAYLSNNIKISDNNVFYNQVSIGTPGEMGSKGDVLLDEGYVVIGSKNTIREFVNFNSPVRRKESAIGDNNYIMARSYLPHDCSLKNNVVVANGASMGGGCIIDNNAYLGLGSVIHQWTDIGESAMIGLQAGVKLNVLPFCVVVGVSGRVLKFNKVGAERRGFDQEEISEVEANFKEIVLGKYVSQNAIITTINSFREAHNENVLLKFV
jgi:UDP-N-acetylglucosamine acyltransferase